MAVCIREEKSKREKQWQQWAAEQKQTFLNQKKEFEADVQRLNEEMATTAVAGRTAAEKITQLVAHGLPEEVPTPREVTEDGSWEQLIAGDADHEMESQEGGFYQEALAASRLLRQATTPTTSTAPVLQIRPEILQQLLIGAGGHLGTAVAAAGSAPPGLVPQAAYTASHPGPPGHLPMGGPGLPVEPSGIDMPSANYGPLMGPKDRCFSPLHPGQRDPAATRVPTNQAAPREGIKDATKAPPSKFGGGSGFLAKLEAKRAAEIAQGSALKPFHGGGAGPRTEEDVVAGAGAPAGASTGAAEMPPTGPQQIDEDDLETQEVQAGTRSPGLNGLG